MADRTVNVLITSFSGVGLPPTLCLSTSTRIPIKDLRQQIIDRLPQSTSRFILTTNSNKNLSPVSDLLVTSLLSSDNDMFLPLRLSVPLCGGKGGFGSQLRAAGGRMSSKRKKNQGDTSSSNRNLDGRRLRTVNEAKALAEYLSLKPDMEKKEKEAKRKRWEQVVESTERREEEVRNGLKGRVDGQWMEDKEEAGERARVAVLAAMKTGNYHDNLSGTSSDSSCLARGREEDEDGAQETSNLKQSLASKPTLIPLRTFAGFDEDDEFMSDSENDEEVEEEEMEVTSKGKDKAKA